MPKAKTYRRTSSSKPAKGSRASAISKKSSAKPSPPVTQTPAERFAPFVWRDPAKAQSTDAEKAVAVEHICKLLAGGGIEMIWILFHVMVPRIAKRTFMDWREAHPDWNIMVDEAFEVGGAVDMMNAMKVAEGLEPKYYGYETYPQRQRRRENEKRDRLRYHALMKRVQLIHHRYRDGIVVAGDKDSPLIPSVFQITPVRARHDDDKPADTTEEE